MSALFSKYSLVAEDSGRAVLLTQRTVYPGHFDGSEPDKSSTVTVPAILHGTTKQVIQLIGFENVSHYPTRQTA